MPDVQNRPSYKGVRATILGLGSFGGGVAAAKFLMSHGARVTITDLKSADDLAESMAELDTDQLENTYLGEHPPEAFDGRQLIVVNPAIRPDHQLLDA